MNATNPDLEREIPQVDAYFGTSDLPQLLKVLGADYKHELVGERLLTTPKHFAYLKIAEGCDRPCSFLRHPFDARETPLYYDRRPSATSTAIGKGGRQRIDVDRSGFDLLRFGFV